jgi:hypothetical protein
VLAYKHRLAPPPLDMVDGTERAFKYLKSKGLRQIGAFCSFPGTTGTEGNSPYFTDAIRIAGFYRPGPDKRSNPPASPKLRNSRLLQLSSNSCAEPKIKTWPLN